MGKKEQVPALAIFVQGSLWVEEVSVLFILGGARHPRQSAEASPHFCISQLRGPTKGFGAVRLVSSGQIGTWAAGRRAAPRRRRPPEARRRLLLRPHSGKISPERPVHLHRCPLSQLSESVLFFLEHLKALDRIDSAWYGTTRSSLGSRPPSLTLSQRTPTRRLRL